LAKPRVGGKELNIATALVLSFLTWARISTNGEGVKAGIGTKCPSESRAGVPTLRKKREEWGTPSCIDFQFLSPKPGPPANLLVKTDRNGHAINYTYDFLSRLAQKQYPDTTTVNYTYDLANRLTQVSDSTGTYGLTYDNMDRLTQTSTAYTFISGNTFTVKYGYDAASNRTSMTDPQNNATSYVYDTLNRLTTLTYPARNNFSFSYDALGRRTKLVRPNAVTTNYQYDMLSELTSILHQITTKSGTTTLDGATYIYDAAGNRTSKTDKRANVTSNFSYDPIYELTQVLQGTTTTESYSYDAVGNRLSSLGVSPYSYNTSNELTSKPGVTYTYDNNGNTLTKVDSTGSTTYTWDFENRLSSVALPGSGGTVRFKYDPYGRRIQKSSSAGTTNYVYDVANVLEEVDGSGKVVARYVQGTGIDQPLAETRGSTTSYYQADGLGSVTSLSNSSGALANTYTYDSFGKLTASTGTLTNPFQYAGREFDPEIGIYNYRARYYDTAVGRFNSEDPIKFYGGIDFYSYVKNDPVNLRDPFGTDPWDWLNWLSVVNYFRCRYYMDKCAVAGISCSLNAGQQDQLTLMQNTNTAFSDDAKLKQCFARECPCQKMVQVCGGIPAGFAPIGTQPPSTPNYP